MTELRLTMNITYCKYHTIPIINNCTNYVRFLETQQRKDFILKLYGLPSLCCIQKWTFEKHQETVYFTTFFIILLKALVRTLV